MGRFFCLFCGVILSDTGSWRTLPKASMEPAQEPAPFKDAHGFFFFFFLQVPVPAQVLVWTKSCTKETAVQDVVHPQ